MLARIRKSQEEREGGFTLIELLVVIIIIGILAAIAIPVFLNQRNKGYDPAAKSDLRNVANDEETLLTDTNAYGARHRRVQQRHQHRQGLEAGHRHRREVLRTAHGYCLSAGTATLPTPTVRLARPVASRPRAPRVARPHPGTAGSHRQLISRLT